MKVKIRYVWGVEGNHIQINDYRVCGPKAWGGGNILQEWEADSEDILRAISVSQQENPADEDKIPVLENTDYDLEYVDAYTVRLRRC